MAGGMGSRYGGLKQVDSFGPNNESILDYSIHDALKAGFTKIVILSSPKLKKNAIPLIGEKCPRGYLRNKSFCFKNCKKDDRKS